MTFDNIKISQEINFNGMPTWISIGGTILPDEDPKDGLRLIQQKITEYHQEEQKAYGQSKWAKAMSESAYGGVPATSMLDDMANCATLEEILSFRLTIKNEEQQALYDKVVTELTNKNN